MAGYTRQSSASILSGEIVSAAPINAEYNQIESAFSASTGHKHDGTTAEGPPIDRIADADQNNKVLIDTSNNHIEFYIDTGASTEQVRIQDGAIVPVTDNDIDLGTASLEFKDLYVDGTANLDTVDIDAGNIDGTIIGASSAAAGTFTNLTASGTINFTGATVTNAGTFSTVDINGGTIDGTVVGGTSAAAGTFTTLTGATVNGTTSITTPSLTATSTVNFSGATVSNLGTVTTANIDGGTIDGTVVGGTSAAAGTFTNLTSSGTVNLTGATVSNGGSVTTVDINGGTIDNAVIGGATPAAGTFSSLVATTADINAGTIDNTVVGGTTPAAGSFTTITSSSNGTVGGNLTVTGNLTVNGTTTTVNSTTVTVDDPIVTLGGDTAPVADDNKDRGVEFRWHNGSSAKTGFFGYDDSTGYFTFIPDGTNTSEVYSGTLGTVEVGGVRLGGTTQTTAYIPSSVAITGGTIDGTTVGGTSAAAGTFSSLVATTADINAGTIDGTTIGGTSAAAGTFTNLTATGTVGLGSSVTISGGSVTGITDLAVADGGTGASTAANARTNLGVAIGSDVQAYDAGLLSIAGLTTAADKMIYTTASDTYAVTDLTAAGRALIDDADASAQRTTLGLGTIATQDANNVNITGGSITGITTFALGSSVKFELDTTTTDADPGSGKLRFNNTNQNTATELYIDDLDDLGTNIESWIQGFSLSTSVVTKGILYIREEQVPSNFLGFKVTGVTNNTGYTKLTVSNVASSATSPFANTDKLLVAYSLTGDKGDTGSLTGPGSSTDNAIARYDGVGGNLTQDSSVLIADDGSMIISGSSSGDMLRITQTGTGNALKVEDSANPDSSPFVVDASGNVGIGESSPAGKLEVEKSSVNYAIIGTSNSGHYFLSQSDDSTDGFEIYQQHGSNTTRNSFIVNDNRTGSKSAAFLVRGDGNVGINTTAPGKLFHAIKSDSEGVVALLEDTSSTQYTGPGIAFKDGSTADGYAVRIGTGVRDSDGTDSTFNINKVSRSNLSFVSSLLSYDLTDEFWSFSTNDVPRLRIDGSGNVGIGTTSPLVRLHLNNTGASSVWQSFTNSTTGTTSNDGMLVGIDSSGNAYVVQKEALPLVFSTSDTERARIDSSGNVGIGTGSPDSALHVYKQTNDRSARFQRISTQYIDIGQTSGVNEIKSTGKNFEIGTTDALDFIIDTSGTERLRIDSSGNVGIGRTPTTNKLEVDGTIESTTGGFKFPDGSTQASAGVSTGKAIAMAIVFG